MADAYTIILGNNEITNCDAALVIEGEEVFRIREEENGALMIDCVAYRILRVEDDSDSGTEQVPPPRGGHLRHDIKCGGVTPTSLDPKTRATVWADNISPAPNKEWEAEFNWQLAAQASVAGRMGTPPAYPWKPERRHQWSQRLRPPLHLLGMTGAD